MLFPVAFGYLGIPESETRKSGFEISPEIVFGHSAFGAGVTVTIVEASNVGVKVGIVGRGVIVSVGGICVGLGVDVEGMMVAV
jgi:hypothetical protein